MIYQTTYNMVVFHICVKQPRRVNVENFEILTKLSISHLGKKVSNWHSYVQKRRWLKTEAIYFALKHLISFMLF